VANLIPAGIEVVKVSDVWILKIFFRNKCHVLLWGDVLNNYATVAIVTDTHNASLSTHGMFQREHVIG